MKCCECGKKIPKARLKAVPDTDYCVACAAEEEKHKEPIAFLPDGGDPRDLMDIVTPDDGD